MQVPRLLGGALSDLRTIAEGMAVLPQAARHPRRDQRPGRARSNEEVKQMRAAVESMGGDVGELRGGMDGRLARRAPPATDASERGRSPPHSRT